MDAEKQKVVFYPTSELVLRGVKVLRGVYGRDVY
jgi:hypothetical protein